MAYFLSFALLLMVPATLPAVCRPEAATCTNNCCVAVPAPAGASAITANCCQAIASQSRFTFVSPDSGQLAVAPLAEIAPPQIVHSFYQGQRTLREFSAFTQPITPQLDPLLKTTQLLI